MLPLFFYSPTHSTVNYMIIFVASRFENKVLKRTFRFEKLSHFVLAIIPADLKSGLSRLSVEIVPQKQE
jgi:flagellar motor switch protein FliG